MLSVDNPLARKLAAFGALTGEERSQLCLLQSTTATVKRGKEVLQEGIHAHKVFIIQCGCTSSYKDLPDGGRQIIGFPLPGDCVGLRGALLKTSDHSFATLTDCEISAIEITRFQQFLDDFPRLRAAFLWHAARDEAMVVEHLVNIGRRSAIVRTAHFFMELAERLMMVGLATQTEFECPLNQYVLADALGLSAIHVNRTLRQLRERKLLTLRAGRMIIHDVGALEVFAGLPQVWGCEHQEGVSPRLFVNRGWTRGLDCEVGANRR